MKIGASIFHFLPHFPFYLHFVHFEKAENEFFFLATTLWEMTKLAMPTLKLVQDEGIGVLSIMCSICSTSSIFTKF